MTAARAEAIDLFSGAGGLTLGFKRTGIVPIVAVERNEDASETYAGHSPDVAHHCCDVRDVDFRRFRGQVPLVFGGPPCQPFSTGGLRRAKDDERDMIPTFLEIVRQVEPEAVFIENVPGLATKSRISYLRGVLHELLALGFTPTWRVLNSADYGVPQKRRRLFIVALRERAFWFPKPSHGEQQKAWIPSGTIVNHEPLGEPPDCPVKFARKPDLRPSPYAGHVYNGGGRPLNLEEPAPTILASAGGYKTHWVDTQGIVPRYHKHLMEGGEPWSGEVPGARRLTVEESALLQTFPPSLVFAGSRSSQYTQVGDAVPPLLAEVLGIALVEQLLGSGPVEEEHMKPAPLQGLLL